jgi:hybrid cluster-associated redox disulfide protein
MATFLAIVALIVAVVALIYAWRLQQELAQAGRRLDRYNKAIFDAQEQIRNLREEAAATAAGLRVQIMQSSGNARFDPQMTIREATILHPQTEQVLAGFHLGGCDHCAVEADETLGQACAQHGVNQEELIANLNMLLGANGAANGSNGAPHFVKLPNVALEFE